MTYTEIENYIHQLFWLNGFKKWRVDFQYTIKYAGRCNCTQKRITISMIAVEKLTSEQLEELCIHEFAHAYNYMVFNNVGHGCTWKECCYLFNYTPKLAISLKLK